MPYRLCGFISSASGPHERRSQRERGAHGDVRSDRKCPCADSPKHATSQDPKTAFLVVRTRAHVSNVQIRSAIVHVVDLRFLLPSVVGTRPARTKELYGASNLWEGTAAYTSRDNARVAIHSRGVTGPRSAVAASVHSREPRTASLLRAQPYPHHVESTELPWREHGGALAAPCTPPHDPTRRLDEGLTWPAGRRGSCSPKPG